MSILKFEPNVPLRLALKYPNGKRVPNQFKPGEEQVMYSFTDGSLGYFPLTVEEQIQTLQIRKGQEIEITGEHPDDERGKREGRMKHTPGPWRVFGPSQGATARLIMAEDPRFGVIASVHRNAGDEPDAIESNAGLIAAAPELLAGCRAALGAFERNDCINWDELRRAIDKAEGR